MIVSFNYLKLYTGNKQSIQTIKIINNFLNNLKNYTIVDANAGIGGNSVFFCKHFKFVYCIDTSIEAIKYLEHNLKDYDNKLIINENCIDILKIINYDVVFFDPPWGGDEYKYKKHLHLYLNDINVNIIINSLYFYCKMVVLKAPINFHLNTNSLWKIHINNIYKNDNKTISFKLIIFIK